MKTPIAKRTLSEIEVIQHDIAKTYARLGAYLIKVKIGNIWVDKCFTQNCLNCERKLPKAPLVGGVVACPAPDCHYERRIYTPEEWQTLTIAESAFPESAFRRSLEPLLSSYL